MEERGLTIEDAVVQVFDSLLLSAKGGDTMAAKVILDRLCGKVQEEVLIETVGQPSLMAPAMFDSNNWGSYLQKLVKSSEELDERYHGHSNGDDGNGLASLDGDELPQVDSK